MQIEKNDFPIVTFIFYIKITEMSNVLWAKSTILEYQWEFMPICVIILSEILDMPVNLIHLFIEVNAKSRSEFC
jgi:hypothetical protein